MNFLATFGAVVLGILVGLPIAAWVTVFVLAVFFELWDKRDAAHRNFGQK